MTNPHLRTAPMKNDKDNQRENIYIELAILVLIIGIIYVAVKVLS